MEATVPIQDITFCIKTIHRPWACHRLVQTLRKEFGEPKIVVVECQGALVADGQPPHFPHPHLLRVALGGSGTLVCFCLDSANLPQREPLNGVGFSIVTTVQPAAAGVLGAVLPTTRTTYPAVSRKGRCREAWEMAASRLGLGRDRCLTGFWRREMEARSPERCSNANVRQQTNG